MTTRPLARGEVRVDVDEDRAGEMAGGVLRASAPGLTQEPAHIDDPQSRIAEPFGQGLGRDER